MWDIQAVKASEVPFKPDGGARVVQFSRDGKRIVTTGDFVTVRVWDAQTLKPIREFPKSQTSLYKFGFSDDSKRLVAAGSGFSVRVWDIETGAVVWGDLPTGNAIATAGYSSDGALILATDLANAARAWDAKTGVPVSAIGHVVTSPVKRLVFSELGRSVIAAHYDGRATVWNPGSARLERIVGTDLPYTNGVAFDSKGNSRAYGSREPQFQCA